MVWATIRFFLMSKDGASGRACLMRLPLPIVTLVHARNRDISDPELLIGSHDHGFFES
jgi:hypothetical protein